MTDDPAVAAMQTYVRNLRKAIEGQSMREVMRKTGIAHTTLMRLINGTTWGDNYTLARLEALLGPLWQRDGMAGNGASAS